MRGQYSSTWRAEEVGQRSCPPHEAAAGTSVHEDIHSARIQQWHMLPVLDQVPAELENQPERQQFEETVQILSSLYAETQKLEGQSYLEACLTAYTIFLCIEIHYEKIL